MSLFVHQNIQLVWTQTSRGQRGPLKQLAIHVCIFVHVLYKQFICYPFYIHCVVYLMNP